jgi:hypothetical protein
MGHRKRGAGVGTADAIRACQVKRFNASGRLTRGAPTVNIHSAIRVTLFYPGVLIPFLSISMAFPNRFNRVSSFLASVIQRQYSLRWV